jgi:putative ABC transport system permease protein
MIILRLAAHSLWHRRLIMGLSLVSIALSVSLLVGVERIRAGVRESFSGTISQTDLIVGAPTGPLQLLLYSVFNIGSGIGRVSYESYSYFASHDDVEWAIPFSFGDSFRGSRVVGTTDAFFKHYRHHGDHALNFAAGNGFEGPLEVVLGADVARKHRLAIGSEVVLSHGVTEKEDQALPGMDHENLRFKVVGLLASTATPIDRSVFVSLESIEAMHAGWEDGAPPAAGEELPESEVSSAELEPVSISGFYLKAKTRLKVLDLQREIAENPEEPLTAVIPGVALAELWQNFAFFENALLLISFFVMGVALTSMFVGIYSSLQVRRREIAILRSLGAGFVQVAWLFVLESWFVVGAAALLGVAGVYSLLLFGQGLLQSQFGIYITPTPPGNTEAIAFGVLLLLGSCVGFIPALKAYQTALSDGLAVKL